MCLGVEHFKTEQGRRRVHLARRYLKIIEIQKFCREKILFTFKSTKGTWICGLTVCNVRCSYDGAFSNDLSGKDRRNLVLF